MLLPLRTALDAISQVSVIMALLTSSSFTIIQQPLQTIEVDGWQFHKNSEVQQYRDTLKDQLLTKFSLCPHRISTTDTVNVENIKKIINEQYIGNK